MVLRITREEAPSRKVTLRLEGRLVATFTRLVQDESRAALDRGSAVVLDLSGVTLVDHAGIDLLLGLERAGVTIAGCSEILASILAAEGLHPA